MIHSHHRDGVRRVRRYAGHLGPADLHAFATPAFWLTLMALVLLLVMCGVYWVVTHLVNKVWLKDQNLKGAGKPFFEMGGAERQDQGDGTAWKTLRDGSEYSHVASAVLALLSLLALASAAVL
jgi:hypothetical protein